MADYSPNAALLNPNKPPPIGPQGPQDHLGRGRGKLLQSSEDIDIPIDRPFDFFPSFYEEEGEYADIYSSAQAADEIVRRSDLLGHQFFGAEYDLQGPGPPLEEPEVIIPPPNISGDDEEEEEPEEEPPDFEAQPGLDFPSEEDEEPAPPPIPTTPPVLEPVPDEPPVEPPIPPVDGGPGDQGPPVEPPGVADEAPFLVEEEVPITGEAEGGPELDFVELGTEGYKYGSAAASVAIIAGEVVGVAGGAAAGGAAAGAGSGAAGGAIAGLSSTGVGAIVAVAVVIAAGIYGVVMSGKARTRRENVYQTTGGIALSDQTKATHDQLGAGHIWFDQASGRVFFVTDWAASSLRQKNATGEYISGRGGNTFATELDPETGAIMQGGFFGDGTGYGFSAAGFLPQGITAQEYQAKWEHQNSPAYRAQQAENSQIASALGMTGKDGTGYDASTVGQYHIVQTSQGGEAGDSWAVVPKPGTAAAREADYQQRQQENAP
jgi:hypothetical protein